LEFHSKQIRSAVHRERDGIAFREGSVKQELAAIFLSTVVCEEAKFGLGKARFS